MKNRLSRKSSEELAQLTLQDAYLLGFGDGHASASTESVEDQTIEHEGKLLRKVNRKAREGDYIRLNIQTNSMFILQGYIYGPVDSFDCVKDADGASWRVYREQYNRTPSTVEVFEVVSDSPPQIENTANEQRAELIEKAKKFVEVKSESLKDSSEIKGGMAFKKQENPNYYDVLAKVEFIVNAEKRTVVALLKYRHRNKIRNKGIAKCIPGDVFNEWIGKAIALAKAMKIDIPVEFLEAVQPTEKVVGMKIVDPRLDDIRTIEEEGFYTEESKKSAIDSESAGRGTIIDDTNALYQVGE